MKYRVLGRTGLRCSEVGLGTWAFGSPVYGGVEEKEALHTIEVARDSGINFFDTAPLYGTPERDGIAEEILGKGVKKFRHEIVISTKFGRNPTEKNAPNFHGCRARESVESSLKRLKTDYIDILFFHSPFSPDEINDDVWPVLDVLKAEGKIRFVGHSISMFRDTEQMARQWAKDGRIDVVQVVYSLMNREAENLITDLNDMEIGIVAREALANGFLSERITRETEFPPGHLNARYSRVEIHERVAYVEKLRFLVRGEIRSMPQAALRWVLDNSAISLVLTGAKSPEEVLECARASDVDGYSVAELQRAREVHVKDFPAA